MKKVTAGLFVSLDGVVESPERWRLPYFNDEMDFITAVMQKREDRWENVSFHNAPVQKQQEEEAGFVIRIKGVDADSEGVRR